MPTSPEEIKNASGEFIAVIEDGAISAEERMQRLRRSLDRLGLLQHDVNYTFDERDYPDAPPKYYNAIRQLSFITLSRPRLLQRS